MKPGKRLLNRGAIGWVGHSRGSRTPPPLLWATKPLANKTSGPSRSAPTNQPTAIACIRDSVEVECHWTHAIVLDSDPARRFFCTLGSSRVGACDALWRSNALHGGDVWKVDGRVVEISLCNRSKQERKLCTGQIPRAGNVTGQYLPLQKLSGDSSAGADRG